MKIINRNLLIVDDDKDVLNIVKNILIDNSFTNIYTAKNKSDALDILSTKNIDMAILDILLPDGTGFDIIKNIRANSNIPVLFLSAITDIEKQYNGFNLGADDYMIKPFKELELILRIKAILNRSYPEEDEVPLDGCSIDFGRAIIIKDNENITMTAKEYNILNLLYKNKNHIVTIDNILSSIWGEEYYGYENTLMAHIRKIRQKIEINPSKPTNLLTFKGLGYKLQVK